MAQRQPSSRCRKSCSKHCKHSTSQSNQSNPNTHCTLQSPFFFIEIFAQSSFPTIFSTVLQSFQVNLFQASQSLKLDFLGKAFFKKVQLAKSSGFSFFYSTFAQTFFYSFFSYTLGLDWLGGASTLICYQTLGFVSFLLGGSCFTASFFTYFLLPLPKSQLSSFGSMGSRMKSSTSSNSKLISLSPTFSPYKPMSYSPACGLSTTKYPLPLNCPFSLVSNMRLIIPLTYPLK